MDKKYLVIFIIISLVILCKKKSKESFTETADTSIVNFNKWLEDNSADTLGFPDGLIMMWSGGKETIPKYWHICNGQEGTPDLRDKFVKGVPEGGTPNTSTPDSKLELKHIPEIPTTSDGDHSHTYDKASQDTYTRAWGARCGDCGNNDGGHPLSNSSTNSGSVEAHTHKVGTSEANQSTIPIPRNITLYFIMKVEFVTEAGIRK